MFPLMSEDEVDGLISLIEAYNLRPGGYHVVRRMALCADIDLADLEPVLDRWAIPPREETPSSYNDLGDFWPRLFGRL